MDYRSPDGDNFHKQLEQRDARIAALEARLEEQEHSLRRVLGLMIEWLEKDEAGSESEAA